MTALASPAPLDARARARALRARAAAAINRACGLVATAAVARAHQHAASPRGAPPAPRPPDALSSVPAARARPAAPSAVLRRPARAQAAAQDRLPDAPPPRWAHARVLAERVVCDDRGERWTVRELDAVGVPGGRGRRCLVFESAGVVRRAWRFPETWHALPADELLRLGMGGP